MFDSVVDVLGMLRPVVAELDPEAMDAEAAAELVERFVEVEQLAAAGRVLATQALEQSVVWRREGFRSAAAWMASRAGTAVRPAAETLEMAGALSDLAVVAAAFRAGRLSEAQAKAVVDAAEVCPDDQQRLVEAAHKLSLAELGEECRRTKAAAIDDDERYRRIRKGRYLRWWTDRDGAVRLSALLTADEGARFLAEVDIRTTDIIEDAYRGGWYEGWDAHRADALVDLARTARHPDAPDGPQAMIHVVVDHEALVRGHTITGEQCEIPGIGPIPVSVARRMADDAILKVLLTTGVDIVAVAHGGRTIGAHLRTALEIRDPKCIVPRCNVRRGLHIDHRDPYTATWDTSLDNLARLCRWHHYQKSHLGYRYRGGPGTWQWIPPDEPVGPPIYPP